MSNQHGDFIWYEVLTNDADATQSFYGKVLGWTCTKSDQPDSDYRHLSAGENGIAGIMPLTDDMKAGGARPCWLGYIAVDDVATSAESIKKAGGNVLMGPMDIPNVGRIMLVADPQGTLFYIMSQTARADGSGGDSKAFAATEPLLGHCAWNELATTDQAAAIKFYTEQFGWRQEGEMDMGPMGTYQFVHQGPVMVGGVMTKPAEMPVSAWTYYFRVADIDGALELVKANGGQITHEPSEIPGGEYMLNGIDPQGAHFALVGPRG